MRVLRLGRVRALCPLGAGTDSTSEAADKNSVFDFASNAIVLAPGRVCMSPAGTNIDVRHNATINSIYELPFGPGTSNCRRAESP